MVRGSDSVDEAIDIQRVLAGLTCKQRTAVELAMQGYTHGDMAQALGISERAIRFRMASARKTFLKTALNHPYISETLCQN